MSLPPDSENLIDITQRLQEQKKQQKYLEKLQRIQKEYARQEEEYQRRVPLVSHEIARHAATSFVYTLMDFLSPNKENVGALAITDDQAKVLAFLAMGGGKALRQIGEVKRLIDEDSQEPFLELLYHRGRLKRDPYTGLVTLRWDPLQNAHTQRTVLQGTIEGKEVPEVYIVAADHPVKTAEDVQGVYGWGNQFFSYIQPQIAGDGSEFSVRYEVEYGDTRCAVIETEHYIGAMQDQSLQREYTVYGTTQQAFLYEIM